MDRLVSGFLLSSGSAALAAATARLVPEVHVVSCLNAKVTTVETARKVVAERDSDGIVAFVQHCEDSALLSVVPVRSSAIAVALAAKDKLPAAVLEKLLARAQRRQDWPLAAALLAHVPLATVLALTEGWPRGGDELSVVAAATIDCQAVLADAHCADWAAALAALPFPWPAALKAVCDLLCDDADLLNEFVRSLAARRRGALAGLSGCVELFDRRTADALGPDRYISLVNLACAQRDVRVPAETLPLLFSSSRLSPLSLLQRTDRGCRRARVYMELMRDTAVRGECEIFAWIAQCHPAEVREMVQLAAAHNKAAVLTQLLSSPENLEMCREPLLDRVSSSPWMAVRVPVSVLARLCEGDEDRWYRAIAAGGVVRSVLPVLCASAVPCRLLEPDNGLVTWTATQLSSVLSQAPSISYENFCLVAEHWPMPLVTQTLTHLARWIEGNVPVDCYETFLTLLDSWSGPLRSLAATVAQARAE